MNTWIGPAFVLIVGVMIVLELYGDTIKLSLSQKGDDS